MSDQTPPTKIYPFGHSLKQDDGPACYYADSADAYMDALSARCTALEQEVARIESEKAAYRTLAELDKVSLVERDERISNLCGELAKARRSDKD